MIDDTEQIRRALAPVINQLTDDEIPTPHWTRDQMEAEFEVKGFMAPFVVVRQKSTGQLGSLEFRHLPRVYFGWEPDVKEPR